MKTVTSIDLRLLQWIIKEKVSEEAIKAFIPNITKEQYWRYFSRLEVLDIYPASKEMNADYARELGENKHGLYVIGPIDMGSYKRTNLHCISAESDGIHILKIIVRFIGNSEHYMIDREEKL